MNTEVAEFVSRMLSPSVPISPSLIERLRTGSPLHVLGIACRDALSLHNSMESWLCGFDELGHSTRLLSDFAAEEISNSCAEFRPDLILLADRFRPDYDSLPAEVPCVSWMHEATARAASASTMAAPDSIDYCLGIAGPSNAATRFMTTLAGVDARCFRPRELTDAELARYRCDVSLIADADETDAFVHEVLTALAELRLDLKIWGTGWESHPALARFANAPVESPSQQAAIYQASRINLRSHLRNSVQPRLLEGLAAGGFFLLRAAPADTLERHYRKILGWCDANGVISDPELVRCATRDIRKELNAVADLLEHDPFSTTMGPGMMQTLRSAEQAGYIQSAGMIWGSDYDAVAFRDCQELIAKVQHFLTDDSGRQQIAERMRRSVLERFTYAAVSRHLLEFILRDVSRSIGFRAAA